MNDPLSSTFRPDRRRILLAGVASPAAQLYGQVA